MTAAAADPAASWLAFLASPTAPRRAMSALELDGYLTGVVVSPNPVPPGRCKIGRNDPCPCGSGKKYKRCCGRT